MRTKDITYEVTNNGCWKSTSHTSTAWGYVRIMIDGKQCKLHRHMYVLYKGAIKDNNLIRHTCDNKWCINPEHLIEGKHVDNMQNRDNRNRTAKGIDNGTARLNEKQVLEIFNNRTDTNRKLAKEYKVTGMTISKIRNGKSWKHITS